MSASRSLMYPHALATQVALATATVRWCPTSLPGHESRGANVGMGTMSQWQASSSGEQAGGGRPTA